MAALYPNTEILQELGRQPSADLSDLYKAAWDDGGLRFRHLYTIRDLLALAQLDQHESLHALLVLLLTALDDGGVCLTVAKDNLTRRLEKWVNAEAAHRLAESIEADLRSGNFSRLIGPPGSTRHPVIRVERSTSPQFYFQKYYQHETRLRRLLQARLQSPETPISENADGEVARVLRSVLKEGESGSENELPSLNSEQRLALALALIRPLTVISGGPGTGKTSIVFTLLRCLVRLGTPVERIALATPTGLAAERLTGALRQGFARLPSNRDERDPDSALANVTAQTIHRLLAYDPTRGQFSFHAGNTLPCDVVIVDEVSMVGLELMEELLQAVAAEATVIFLGDKDQLPSVEAGAILAHLTPEGADYGFSSIMVKRLQKILPGAIPPPAPTNTPLIDSLVVLKENYRSDKRIQKCAAAVNSQAADFMDTLPELDFHQSPKESEFGESRIHLFGHNADRVRAGGCWRWPIKGDSPASLQRILGYWVDQILLGEPFGESAFQRLVEECSTLDADSENGQVSRRELFNRLQTPRILSILREGLWGSIGINEYVIRLLRKRFRYSQSGHFPGTPIMVTANDNVRGLYNGDIGVILAGKKALFSKARGFVSFPIHSLPAHEPAFAQTVHKSQGSEYDLVLLVIPPEGGKRLLTKEIIYTAVTRAKKAAILCGDPEVLKQAIRRKIDRESGLVNALVQAPPS